MAAIAALAISDGTVVHTLNPVNSGLFPAWRDSLASTPIVGQPTVGASIKLDKSDKGLNRVKWTMVVPVLETATAQNAQGYTAAPKVAFTVQLSVDAVLPSRSTAAQRTAVRTLCANLMVNSQFVDSVDNLIVPY